MEEKKNKSKILIVVIIILILVIIGMGGYIAYDKGVIFSGVDKEEKQKDKKKENKENKENNKDNEKDTSNEERPLNLSKCLNNSNNNTYSNSSDVEGNYGLSMNVNADKKSITLSIDWKTFGPLSGASYAPVVDTYQITGFSKEIISTFVGDLGQDAKGITLFYLMSDQTVEYTPMFTLKFDNNNNSYYEMNYTYDKLADGRITNPHFVTKGIINGANSIIKLYNADVSNGSGWRTTIGAKKDGSFYDLGTLIQ